MEEDREDEFDNISAIVIRMDVTDAVRSVELSRNRRWKIMKFKPTTVIEILTEEILSEGFGYSLSDDRHGQSAYSILEKILAEDYSLIAGLLATKLGEVLQDIEDEPIVGCSNAKITTYGVVDFTLYARNS